MNCWSCGSVLPDPQWGRISFRATCDHCDAGLHCCRNCKFYKPGQFNDCAVPGTEPIRDCTTNNFCEEFSLLGKPPLPKDSRPRQRFDDLFKE